MADLFNALRAYLNIRPDAYSRLSRTPIFKAPLPDGIEGLHRNDLFGSRIVVPQGDTIDDTALRHESAHAIYDKAGMSKIAPVLAPKLGRTAKDTITSSPFYQSQGITPELLANEGLGFSVEDPTQSQYTQSVANQITDPKLALALLRLQKRK